MLSIIYQDEYFVAVNKPCGLLVHRSDIDRHAVEFALQMLRDQLGRHVFPVHRLDRPTSGALIFALSSESARDLAQEFSGNRVSKSYLAVVRGEAPESARIDYPLREELDRKSDRLAKTDKPPQEAETDLKRLASVELPFAVDKFPTTIYSLVHAQPKTGRKHQIRRHLRHLGHPIVGDVKHGSGKHNRFFREHFGCDRLLLACTEISFNHPYTKTSVSVHAPLAPEFQDVLIKLGWGAHA